MLGGDIHSGFGQIHIGIGAGGSDGAGFGEGFTHDGSRHRMRPHAQRAQIWRDVDKYLVNRVDMGVPGHGVFEAGAIYLPVNFQIVHHVRSDDNHRDFEPWRVFQIARITGFPD